MNSRLAGAIYALIFAASAACTSGDEGEARAASPASAATSVPTTEPATASASLPSMAAIRYVTASSGNAARYRVREQLVGVDLPNDAIGETRNVTGGIAADARGNVIPAESKFVIDVTNLTSDKQRRDGFVRGRVLETDQYPTVTFVPKSVRGLSAPVPRSGTRAFEVLGDLTVRNVTKPTLWKVTAKFSGDKITGTAKTGFTFDDFSIQQPRVPVVLSVGDSIHLELDFNMVPQATKR